MPNTKQHMKIKRARIEDAIARVQAKRQPVTIWSVMAALPKNTPATWQQVCQTIHRLKKKAGPKNSDDLLYAACEECDELSVAAAFVDTCGGIDRARRKLAVLASVTAKS